MLDIGCGTGHYMGWLAQRGYAVAGVDASEQMLAAARENNPGAALQRSDVDRLPFPDASFDLVVCIEVLRYLPAPRNAIAEMARVLKPGGIALVTALPLFNANGYFLVNQVLQVVSLGKLHQLRQFFTTAGRLRRQFAAAGFSRVGVEGVYTGPVNWVERLVRPALPRFLRAWEPLDRRLADAGPLREFANMFLVHAVRGS